METSDYNLYIQLMDLYKAKRLEDYLEADRFFRAAQELLATSDFTDEELTELANAGS
jgi:hypothetical protein